MLPPSPLFRAPFVRQGGRDCDSYSICVHILLALNRHSFTAIPTSSTQHAEHVKVPLVTYSWYACHGRAPQFPLRIHNSEIVSEPYRKRMRSSRTKLSKMRHPLDCRDCLSLNLTDRRRHSHSANRCHQQAAQKQTHQSQICSPQSEVNNSSVITPRDLADALDENYSEEVWRGLSAPTVNSGKGGTT